MNYNIIRIMSGIDNIRNNYNIVRIMTGLGYYDRTSYNL